MKEVSCKALVALFQGLDKYYLPPEPCVRTSHIRCSTSGLGTRELSGMYTALSSRMCALFSQMKNLLDLVIALYGQELSEGWQSSRDWSLLLGRRFTGP